MTESLSPVSHHHQVFVCFWIHLCSDAEGAQCNAARGLFELSTSYLVGRRGWGAGVVLRLWFWLLQSIYF